MTFLALCYHEDDAFAWSFLVKTDDAQAIAKQAYPPGLKITN